MASINIHDYLNKCDDIFNSLDGYFDLEHAYWKHLPRDKIIQVETIGVKGYVANGGRYQED